MNSIRAHAVFGFFGTIALLGSFLTPVRVAPVCYVLGLGCIFMAIVLKGIQNYEDACIERHNRERRRFE